MTAFFGADDIDFESARFSERFHVKSPDRKWAYDVIHTKTMERLLRSRVFRIKMVGPHIMLWHNRVLDTAGFDAALNLGYELVEGIPADIRREIRYDREPYAS